jgi:hypothetical protein
MARISVFADVQIIVVFPFLTKSLKEDQRERVLATGTFPYVPKPQVESIQAASSRQISDELLDTTGRVDRLKKDFDDMLKRLAKIREATRKRAKNVVFEYDPTLAENESYADAEETLFGVASGTITYAMYESLLDFEKKLDKWIGHKAISQEGLPNG